MDGNGLEHGDFTVPEDADDYSSVFENPSRTSSAIRSAYEISYTGNSMVIYQSQRGDANIFDLRGRLQPANLFEEKKRNHRNIFLR